MPTSLSGPRNHSSEPIVHPIDRDDYQALLKAGRLDEWRMDLVDGVIYETPRVSPPHAVCISHLTGVFLRTLVERSSVRCRLPLDLSCLDAPEPDIALVQRSSEGDESRDPNAGETALIVEVSGSSLAFNRGVKARRYCAAGVNDYWIINLDARQIEVYRKPNANENWSIRFVVPESRRIAPLCAPEVDFAVADLLPRAPDNPVA